MNPKTRKIIRMILDFIVAVVLGLVLLPIAPLP